MKITTFPNNLKLVYEHHDAPITSINIFVRVGSIYENNKNIQGLSHFIEHMVFKGTKNIKSSSQISTIFDEIGATFNAYTDKNITCYSSKCESSHFNRCFITLCDILINPIFKKNHFLPEKNVVLEELNLYNDMPDSWIQQKIYELIFNGSTLSHDIAGTKHSILNYSFQDFHNYYNSFYNPSNMTVSIISNISFDSIKTSVKSSYLFNNIQPKLAPFYPIWAINNTSYPRIDIKENKELEQLHFAIGFKTCSSNDEDKYVLEVISNLLSGNMSSRLFINLREKNGITYTVDINTSNYEEVGEFSIYTSVDKYRLLDSNLGKGALSVIIDELKKLTLMLISNQELNKVKGFIKGSIAIENDNIEARCDYNGRMVCLLEKEIIPIHSLYDMKYNNVSSKDILRVSRKYFTINNLSISIIGNVNENSTLNKVRNICSLLS